MLNSKALAASVSAAPAVYVEDVFSTFLYTGTGAARTITNGIDLSGKGGLNWTKFRSGSLGSESNSLIDTARGANKYLLSDATALEQSPYADTLTAFGSSGYSLGADVSSGRYNWSAQNYASWTFRKQPKFFDVVTYTGNGTSQNIAHSLGSVPGCIIVKRTSAAADWLVYHRSLGNTQYISLNSTGIAYTAVGMWDSTTPSSTFFTVGNSLANANGETYVAYLFAHNAGGFGTAGTDNVVSCGTFSGTGFVNLGWEPQWILIKPYSQTYNWEIYDNMRGMGQPAGASSGRVLRPNTSDAEANGSSISFEATGFTQTTFGASYPCIYIAIRRGPMKTPTVGTEVFAPLARNTNGTTTTITTTLSTVDMVMFGDRNGVFYNNSLVIDRLQGASRQLATSSTAANQTSTDAMAGFDVQTGYRLGPDSGGYGTNYSAGGPSPIVNWQFRRAPGFFDVVAYTGTGSNTTVTHNLGVAPELMIVKNRSLARDWAVGTALNSTLGFMRLNTTQESQTGSFAFDTLPTSTALGLGISALTNENGQTFIAYLFATLNGVSKVGSYTGTGTTKQIDCGFTAGARLVLIKRTDSAGNWITFDTARGIISGDEPHLALNTTNPEVTGTDYIDPLSSGFEISSTAPSTINANGGSFIFLAIA